MIKHLLLFACSLSEKENVFNLCCFLRNDKDESEGLLKFYKKKAGLWDAEEKINGMVKSKLLMLTFRRC